MHCTIGRYHPSVLLFTLKLENVMLWEHQELMRLHSYLLWLLEGWQKAVSMPSQSMCGTCVRNIIQHTTEP